MNFSSLKYRYPSRRALVYGRKGMVATSQPLASLAGLDIIKKGGNAIDAAIATAACLTVVEPTSNGIGSDAFAIVWTGGEIYGLNSSGPAPKAISIDKLKNKGYASMPKHGTIPVNVPGAPFAWRELSKRFGKLPLSEVLKPAISYAFEGYPISPTTAENWKRAFQNYKDCLKGEEFKHWFETFAPSGKAPEVGEIWRNEDMASTLQELADTECLSFYEGDLADKIDRFFKKHGGYLRKEDLSNFRPEWVKPISTNYRGYDIWELPPNTHGLVVLLALNILSNFDIEEINADTYHILIEAMKLAYADGLEYITDLKNMKTNVADLMNKGYSRKRSELIGKEALLPKFGVPNLGGTVYLSTADGEGNMVSYIQSNYMGFGSGIVIPNTGISLHNRGFTFSLDPSHINCLEPGKKTYHTLIPGFISKSNEAIGPFGVMGAYMQPQGHFQVVTNMIDLHMNPQEAIDAPRWQWIDDRTIDVEESFSVDIAESLRQKGHNVVFSKDVSSFGRGQIILKDSNGVLIGGTEPRTDGMVCAW